MRSFILILLLLSACTKNNPTGLKIAFNTHPNTKDPRWAADFVSSTLVCLLYDGLTRCLPGGGVELALAESVEIDGARYVFHLRKAQWSDGTWITAYDFERSWKEVIYPPRPCAFLFYPIKNAEKAARGELTLDRVGVWAQDALTLVVELERATPYFYSLTAFPSFLPAPKQENVYSGPFKMELEKYSREIVLKKNGTFWNQSQIDLDTIHIHIIPDEMCALQMFEKGDLDWMGSSLSPLPFDALDTLERHLQFAPSAGSTFCTFNTAQFPFQNRSLRKAFSLAIDRQTLLKKTHAHIPAKTLLPPSLSTQSFPLFDPEMALLHFEQGLQELGIEKKDLETIPLYFRSNQTEKRIAQILQKQWQDLFHITLPLVQLDYKSHAHKLKNKGYQMALASWIAQFDDPASLLDRFRHADHLKNYPGWENRQFVSCLDGFECEMAEKILIDEVPITPIYHWSSPMLVNPRIKTMAFSPCGGILFERFKTL